MISLIRQENTREADLTKNEEVRSRIEKIHTDCKRSSLRCPKRDVAPIDSLQELFEFLAMISLQIIFIFFFFFLPQVIVFQEYSNNSSTPIEAKYVFPLDDMAAGLSLVDGLIVYRKIRNSF